MANKQQLFDALNAARSAANDTSLPEQKQNEAKQRAAQIATMIKQKVGQQRQQLQTTAGQIRTPGDPMAPSPQLQEQRLQGEIQQAERPENAAQTRAARNLPELFESGILQGQNPAKVAQFAAIASLTPDPRELADIATNMFPDLGMQEDPGGNILLGNNQTGVQAIINRPGFSGTDMAQFTGGAAAFTPAGRASTLAAPAARQGVKQAAKGAAAAGGTQAGIEGAQAASGGQFNPEQIGMAAALEPVVAAGQTATRAIRGRPSREAQEVLDAGAREGVDVMTSDVRQPKGFIGGALLQYAERVPFIGTSGRRASQQRAREQAAHRLFENADPVRNEDVLQELIKSTKTQKRKAGQVIRQIDEQMNQAAQASGGVPINNTLSKIDELIQEFQKPGTPSDSPAVSTLQEIRKSLTEAPQDFTLLRQNRRWINEKINQIDLAGQSQMSSNSKRLMGQLSGAINQDMRRFVRDKAGAARTQDFVQADRAYEDIAKDMTKTRLKNVLDKGEFTPEAVETLLLSSKPSEQKLLFKNLTPRGREHAKFALVQRAIEKAGGVDDMTPNRLQTQLNKVMDGLKTFGNETDVKQLRGLERLLQSTRRAQDFSAVTPTGQSMFVPQTLNNMTTGGVINMVVGAVPAVGARIYESRPVRNALVRLANVPRQSQAEERAIADVMSAITGAAQTTLQQQSQPEREFQQQPRSVPTPEVL